MPPFFGDARDRGRVCFIPHSVWKSIAIEEGARGWRAVVEGVSKAKALLITCVGEKGTRNAKVPFKIRACESKGIVPITL